MKLPTLLFLYRKVSDTTVAAGECAQLDDPNVEDILRSLAHISSMLAALIEAEVDRLRQDALPPRPANPRIPNPQSKKGREFICPIFPLI